MSTAANLSESLNAQMWAVFQRSCVMYNPCQGAFKLFWQLQLVQHFTLYVWFSFHLSPICWAHKQKPTGINVRQSRRTGRSGIQAKKQLKSMLKEVKKGQNLRGIWSDHILRLWNKLSRAEFSYISEAFCIVIISIPKADLGLGSFFGFRWTGLLWG